MIDTETPGEGRPPERPEAAAFAAALGLRLDTERAAQVEAYLEEARRAADLLPPLAADDAGPDVAFDPRAGWREAGR